MTRGITQAAVFAAADQLLTAGERPTVERIRAVLGSGSPNTVIRYLDAWWADAGHRLKVKASVPELPPEVAELAIALWTQAIKASRSHAQAELSAAHAELDSERQRMEASGIRLAAETQRQADALARAEQTLASQASQLDAWTARATDWESERERMLTEADRLATVSSQDRAALDVLRDQHAALQQQTERERAATVEHLRSVEDRAHSSVDAARQELKALRLQVSNLQRDASGADATLGRERASHAKTLSGVEKELAAARAKAQALECALTAFTSRLDTAAAAKKKAASGPRKPAARKTKAKG